MHLTEQPIRQVLAVQDDARTLGNRSAFPSEQRGDLGEEAGGEFAALEYPQRAGDDL